MGRAGLLCACDDREHATVETHATNKTMRYATRNCTEGLPPNKIGNRLARIIWPRAIQVKKRSAAASGCYSGPQRLPFVSFFSYLVVPAMERRTRLEFKLQLAGVESSSSLLSSESWQAAACTLNSVKVAR